MTREYLAGFFDGEGCIGIYRNGSKAWYVSVQVVQASTGDTRALLASFGDQFGGSVSRPTPSSSGRERINWHLYGEKAVSFLEYLLPCLVLKRDQAWIAIEWWRADASTRQARGVEVAAAVKELKKH